MIKELIEKEYGIAVDNLGAFNSEHEAYAIIREEVEEAYENVGHLGFWLDNFWNQIKSKEATNKVKVESITAMKRYATDAITEFAQVAACCEKALDIMGEEVEDNNK